MVILNELKSFFASKENGAVLLESMPINYPAYAVRRHGIFGVAIEWGFDKNVSEFFSSVHLHTVHSTIEGENKNLLVLSSDREEYRNEFASVCAQFIDPGENGRYRVALLEDPIEWWKSWKNLLGNASLERTPYTVLCEMIALHHVLSFDPTAQWTASQSGTHDIESERECYEVKSTKMRYGSTITISSQHQLLAPKPLSLFFVRVEESPTGVSINAMADILVSSGYDSVLLENQLAKMRYEKGASDRDKKYAILEKRVYVVDDSFPRITAESFKGDVIPSSILSITYTVDLEGIPYKTW
jgi:hypothetical protein